MSTEAATAATRYSASMARALGCLATVTVTAAVVLGSLAPLAGLAAAALIMVSLSVLCVWRITGQWHGSAGTVMLGYRRVYAENPLRKITGRRVPDRASIAAMERDIYGETFEHEGAPKPGFGPIATMLLPEGLEVAPRAAVRATCLRGHEVRIGGEPPQTCPTCDEQRERLTRPDSDRPARKPPVRDSQARSDSFWSHIDEARRLTEQINAANRPDDADTTGGPR